MLDLGARKLWVLEDGMFITDAGNLLGGSRRMRLRGAMHAVLVETDGALVLVDAGFGPEIPPPLADHYELRRERSLPESVRAAGRDPQEITHVVLSHLDPDHVGWALAEERVSPRATVHVQRAALEEARRMPENDGRRLAVPAVERGAGEGWLELLEGNGEVAPGIRVEVRSGHSAGHQVVWIEGEERAALFTADLAPAKIWLNPDLIAGVDTDPEAARRNRIEVLSEAEEKAAPVILYHEPRDFLVTIRRTGEGFEGVPLEA
ncbi:hypothetical protein RxyAA322_05980 [Rubrobacter xylanophilus]|uniref:Metallo-beta-lactamase domain-containing protein n=1 Tax=Rubrobacter xylanophilus TaxID=49319 RepID=A0A510HFM4_9ACTN|nr:MBL fold metallo-hydrolase [Rubrobacter xylanophilus]BBL78744.1 hypothetical protein RxyAA322_05980 [Rubrobacter xylanophilus]